MNNEIKKLVQDFINILYNNVNNNVNNNRYSPTDIIDKYNTIKNDNIIKKFDNIKEKICTKYKNNMEVLISKNYKNHEKVISLLENYCKDNKNKWIRMIMNVTENKKNV